LFAVVLACLLHVRAATSCIGILVINLVALVLVVLPAQHCTALALGMVVLQHVVPWHTTSECRNM